MYAAVYAEKFGKKRFLGNVLYDCAARAIDMYEDECEEDEIIILVHKDED